MKKIFVIATLVLSGINLLAQDVYKIAELGASDLNGTARYVGMGGAMSALGGDISTMSSNAAAIGLYRRSDIAATGSLANQPGGQKFYGKSKTYASFDQLGFVYCCPVATDALQFINFGVNYHKQRDYNMLAESTSGDLAGNGYASQTWELAQLCNYWGGVDDATPLANMADDVYLLGEEDGYYTAYGATKHYYNKARWGANNAIDFNLSANINDRVYIGLTATGYDVRKKSFSEYSEDLITVDMEPDGYYILQNSTSLKGVGFDAKVGIIVRPMYNSNFKIGLNFTTPTYYDLTYRNEAWIGTYDIQWGESESARRLDYDYKVRTPWKMNVSIGNTFFNRLALGAEYEFADYSCCSVSYGRDYGYYSSNKDKALNRLADKYLKSTHTLKVGAELMVTPNIFLRGGYNYVSSAFDKEAYYNQYINIASVDAATSTDYMNLSAINRFSAGIGFKYKSFYADMAWMYEKQHGDLYTFAAQDDLVSNCCPVKRQKLDKTRLMLTLGYRF